MNDEEGGVRFPRAGASARMSSEHGFPARIHVLLARDAPTGVVFRRGPSKLVCTLGWNRLDDTFTRGQWLKGRIYERRSDLSPDGRYLIYFAMNGKWKSEAKGSWTAISKAPYLKAIGLWAKGDCWHGGGMFVDAGTYWLNDGFGHETLRTPDELTRAEHYPGENAYGGECPGVYYLRLQRDGWRLVNSSTDEEPHRVYVFEKPVGTGWVLRKLAYATLNRPVGKGCYYDEHELENSTSRERIALTGWEWADVDRARLVWGEGGKLFAARVADAGIVDRKELHEFNAMTFEAVAAPY